MLQRLGSWERLEKETGRQGGWSACRGGSGLQINALIWDSQSAGLGLVGLELGLGLGLGSDLG